MKYKSVQNHGPRSGCYDCCLEDKGDCMKIVKDLNLPSCDELEVHYEEVYSESDKLYNDSLDTDCMGNCFSDADPGL